MRGHLQCAEQGLRERMQVGSQGQSGILVQHMGRVGQVVVLVCRFWPVFGDFIEIVAAVAEIEQVPVVMVAPILHVLTTEVGEWMVRPLWRKDLARSARC